MKERLNEPKSFNTRNNNQREDKKAKYEMNRLKDKLKIIVKKLERIEIEE